MHANDDDSRLASDGKQNQQLHEIKIVMLIFLLNHGGVPDYLLCKCYQQKRPYFSNTGYALKSGGTLASQKIFHRPKGSPHSLTRRHIRRKDHPCLEPIPSSGP